MPPQISSRQLDLRHHTPARVSLPTTGNSIATTEVLDFQLAHAKARDAVHATLDLPTFTHRLQTELPILTESEIPILQLRTNAPDRTAYLRHPNLGRTLHPESLTQLHPTTRRSGHRHRRRPLRSSRRAQRHPSPHPAHPATPRRKLDHRPHHPGPTSPRSHRRPHRPTPSRTLSLILIGERPGLSSPDSLGAYLTWSPHPSRTDADRNCLSNIRYAGLSPEAAATRLFWYLQTARTLQQTGIALKEGSLELNAPSQSRNQQG